MTNNQIQYQRMLEERRSNRAQEIETKRSNLAREGETIRSNLVREAETHRANRANETIGLLGLNETIRSNVAKETETNRANVAKETETNRSNLAKEAETKRHNEATETIDAFKLFSSTGRSVPYPTRGGTRVSIHDSANTGTKPPIDIGGWQTIIFPAITGQAPQALSGGSVLGLPGGN